MVQLDSLFFLMFGTSAGRLEGQELAHLRTHSLSYLMVDAGPPTQATFNFVTAKWPDFTSQCFKKEKDIGGSLIALTGLEITYYHTHHGLPRWHQW